MKKPLTFCLVATTSLLALAATDNVGFLALNPDTYDIVQLMLAMVSVGVAVFHVGQRVRQRAISVVPLIFGIIAGTLTGVVATKNPMLGTQLCGIGSILAHTSILALVVDSILCLLSYAELDGAESLAEQESPPVS
ncbi:hypothetical protein F6X40_35415 [Paraburkholderia sp. UCT31]|uniref:hypothetical protein n=1 Tax=Paraburkholderia sp. UCT31 TaxID=2615209 RepID=UPI0016559BC1|nr:hypothetical protein [Paraburkholderia sp. UCT31]MBC8741840.1 hypothetical protein [Paraburkholderia sp. UCT31]